MDEQLKVNFKHYHQFGSFSSKLSLIRCTTEAAIRSRHQLFRKTKDFRWTAWPHKTHESAMRRLKMKSLAHFVGCCFMDEPISDPLWPTWEHERSTAAAPLYVLAHMAQLLKKGNTCYNPEYSVYKTRNQWGQGIQANTAPRYISHTEVFISIAQI